MKDREKNYRMFLALSDKSICIIPRWGNTALQDAIRFEQQDVANLLMQYQESYTSSLKRTEDERRQMSLENLESMV